MDLLSNQQVQDLTNEYEILHLIYFRSKNQHRLLIWWKFANILHRKLRFLLKLFIDIERTKNKDVREYKRIQIVDTAKYLLFKILKKAFYEFNSIIALGQFIKLGFVLVGLTSKIYAILLKIKGVDNVSKRLESSVSVGADFGSEEIGEIVNAEIGEVINEVTAKEGETTANNEGVKSINKLPDTVKTSIDDIFNDKPKKRKKEKKKKSAIDDIFG